MRSLHITNGDGAAEILKASTVEGDVLPWRDPMHHGPFPAGLTLDELAPVRARYLAETLTGVQEIERDFRLRDDHFKAAPSYDRVLLWFEHDLLDQLQILQLLDWFADVELGDTRLEMICINSFPGFPDFRGIGQLNPIQMVSLLDRCQPVTLEMLSLARKGWLAFRSDDPRRMQQFIAGDVGALPFLKDALVRHFEEFPSLQTGLTRTEMQLLKLVEKGVQAPGQLFLQNMDHETALFIGDWPTYSVIKTLCEAGLLSAGDKPFWYGAMEPEDHEAFCAQRLSLTENGQVACAGGSLVVPFIQRDQWLGGVHVKSGAPHWCWDAQAQSFVWHKL